MMVWEDEKEGDGGAQMDKSNGFRILRIQNDLICLHGGIAKC